jgi:thymidine kinase
MNINSPRKYGEIQVIYGPMFSGKSTELLRRIRRYTAARKSCVVLKYHLDNRYAAGDMSTHDSYEI